MSDNSIFCADGQDLIKQAVKKDNDKDYRRALSLYKQALLLFRNELTDSKNEPFRETVESYLTIYVKRARELKIQLGMEEEQGKTKRKQECIVASAAISTQPEQNHKEEKKKDELKDASTTNKSMNSNSNSTNSYDVELINRLKSSVLITKNSDVKLSDIKGLEQTKQILQNAIDDPILYKSIYKKGKGKYNKGILLYGPPGTGKTILVKAIAAECKYTFLDVDISDLINKYQGESERLVHSLFELAKQNQPCIIFIDEIESLITNRATSSETDETSKRMKTQLLTRINDLSDDKDYANIILIGATNLPWTIDPAFRRRFTKRVYVPLPDFPARLAMVKSGLEYLHHEVTEDNMNELASVQLQGYSGADVSTLFSDIVSIPLEPAKQSTYFEKVMIDSKEYYKPLVGTNHIISDTIIQTTLRDLCQQFSDEVILYDKIQYQDILRVLKRVKATNNETDLVQFTQWTAEFGQDGS